MGPIERCPYCYWQTSPTVAVKLKDLHDHQIVSVMRFMQDHAPKAKEVLLDSYATAMLRTRGMAQLEAVREKILRIKSLPVGELLAHDTRYWVLACLARKRGLVNEIVFRQLEHDRTAHLGA